METKNTEIQKLLRIIKGRRYLFIILSLSIMSVIVWGTYFLPKEYEAKSTVFIERNVIKELVKGIAVSPSMEARMKVLRNEMLSRGLIIQVLKDIDLDVKARGNDKKLDEMITEFQNKTQIAIREGNLFIVSIRNSNPKIARDYINNLVRRYVEENTSSKREESYGATKFLDDQLVITKEKLAKAEDAVNKYTIENGLYIPTDDKTLIDEVRRLRGEIDEIQVKKNELIATRESIQRQLKGEEPFTVNVYKKADNSVPGTNVSALERRLDQLLVKYTENYPEVIKLKAEIESLKKQQALAPQKGSDSLTDPEMSSVNPVFMDLRQRNYKTEADVNSLDAKQKQVLSMIASRERQLRSTPESKKRLTVLQRDRDSIKALYEQLATRQQQAEVSKQMEVQDKSTTFRIVDPAVLPTKPASPDRIKLILFGIVFGLVGGLAAIFVRESFDHSVKESQTLKALGLSVIAVIPTIINESEQKEKAKKERLVYAIAGSYFLVICATFLFEVMGLSYVDAVIAGLSR